MQIGKRLIPQQIWYQWLWLFNLTLTSANCYYPIENMYDKTHTATNAIFKEVQQDVIFLFDGSSVSSVQSVLSRECFQHKSKKLFWRLWMQNCPNYLVLFHGYNLKYLTETISLTLMSWLNKLHVARTSVKRNNTFSIKSRKLFSKLGPTMLGSETQKRTLVFGFKF